MNITKRKVVDSVLKNHKPFFVNIGADRDISLQTRQLFVHFRPVKFCSRDRAPPNKTGIHDAVIKSYSESRFQLFRFNRLLVISKSIVIYQNSRKKQRFYALARSPNK